MSHAIINQIRHLQAESKEFALELVSGRIIQIYNPHEVATNENGHGSVGVLHGDGAFEVIVADQVVSVSVGVHPVEKERWERQRAEMEKRFGRKSE